jgi:cell division protein FtsB
MGDPFHCFDQVNAEQQHLSAEYEELQRRTQQLIASITELYGRELKLRQALGVRYRRDFGSSHPGA